MPGKTLSAQPCRAASGRAAALFIAPTAAGFYQAMRQSSTSPARAEVGIDAGTRALHAWRRIVPERTRLMIPAFLRRAGRDLLCGPVTRWTRTRGAQLTMRRGCDGERSA